MAFCLLAALPLLLPELAHSAQVARANNRSSAGGYEVAIPRSRIEIPQPSEPSAPHVPTKLDISFSSWSPNHFSIPGRIQNAGEFSRGAAPSLSINSLIPATFLYGFYLKTGVTWTALNRSGKVGSETSTVTETQTLHLLSLRAGAEYTPPVLHFFSVQPYAGAALLPSLGFTGRSAFDDGSSHFGIPLEYSLGALFDLPQLGFRWSGAQFDLGINGTFGTIHHSSVAGLGVRGGIRMSL
jgi:hypothetical protein